MSEDATILGGLRYVQTVFKQVSILLQTSDELLSEHGFTTACGNQCIVETSSAVTLPVRWLPSTVFRFYLSDDSPRVLLFVSVLLDDRNSDFHPPALTECLLTAGAFIHKSEKWDQKWSHWWARYHGYQHDRRDDGTVVSSEISEWRKQRNDETRAIERFFTVGVPLPTVKSSAELKAFLAPLLGAVERYRLGAAEP